jgi:hypothetical protein
MEISRTGCTLWIPSGTRVFLTAMLNLGYETVSTNPVRRDTPMPRMTVAVS